MKNLYIAVRNMLLFFFIATIFGPNNILKDTSVVGMILVGLLFGICMMLIPNILKFFKLPVNTGSLFLMGIMTSFLFFFVGLYVLGFITIPAGGVINFGVSFISPLVMADRTVALVVLSLFSAISSIGLEILGRQK